MGYFEDFAVIITCAFLFYTAYRMCRVCNQVNRSNKDMEDTIAHIDDTLLNLSKHAVNTEKKVDKLTEEKKPAPHPASEKMKAYWARRKSMVNAKPNNKRTKKENQKEGHTSAS